MQKVNQDECDLSKKPILLSVVVVVVGLQCQQSFWGATKWFDIRATHHTVH